MTFRAPLGQHTADGPHWLKQYAIRLEAALIGGWE